MSVIDAVVMLSPQSDYHSISQSVTGFL